MLEKLRLVEERYLEMAERAGQPDFYADPKAASKLLREQKRLEPIVTAYRSYHKTARIYLCSNIFSTDFFVSFTEYAS